MRSLLSDFRIGIESPLLDGSTNKLLKKGGINFLVGRVKGGSNFLLGRVRVGRPGEKNFAESYVEHVENVEAHKNIWSGKEINEGSFYQLFCGERTQA